MYALIDCNNFYASCERLFRPDLRDKPIVVLSNNDGCVIARSEEAKAIGIPMGVPYFKVKALSEKHQVHIFSSNFALYGDLSGRVMSILHDSWPHCEIYSIDEAFLDISTLPSNAHNAFCDDLRKRILKATGIPVSIGIGQTKTLAKLANYIAKKCVKEPVFNIVNQREWLASIPVNEVWGVGRNLHQRLEQVNIHTAADLAETNKHALKKRFSVVLMRTAMELAGTICLGLEPPQPSKSMIASRSFGKMVTDLSELNEAVSLHCARAYEKVRAQQLLVGHIQVFVYTNRHRKDLAQRHVSTGTSFVIPTDDLRYLTRAAKYCLKTLFQAGYHYKKIGVCFSDLIAHQGVQLDLLNQPDKETLAKKENLMQLIDDINHRFGRKTMMLAATGTQFRWLGRSDLRSPRYTTQWDELPKIHCHLPRAFEFEPSPQPSPASGRGGI